MEAVGKAGRIPDDPVRILAMTAQKENVAPDKKAIGTQTSELHKRRWAVVSYNGLVKSGLSYPGAERLASSEVKKGTPGVCIVTEEAAARIEG